MSHPDPYLLLMEPAIQERPWGGTRIRNVLGKRVPAALEGKPLGESWEVSTHPNGPSRIANGPLAGSTLAEAFHLWQDALVGPAVRARHGATFPLLVKIIEVNTLASVQVHPDDAQALRLESYPSGKSEAWYIIDTSPTAEAYIGFRRGVDAAAFRRAVEQGAVRETLEPVRLAPGDCALLEPGTVHACGNGILLLEVQQSSDITYRVYDWDRVDDRGKRRELHLEKALEVIDFEAVPRISRAGPSPDGVASLVATRHFRVDELRLTREARLPAGPAFRTLTVITGACHVTAGVEVELRGGQTALLPAGIAATLRGEARVILASPAI